MKRIYRDKKELIESLIGDNDVVLDVGFWGQGMSVNDVYWPHRFLQSRARAVYGLDIDFDMSKLPGPSERYKKGSADGFDFGTRFNVIFAGDLIEHLSNPGLFLAACARNLAHDGRLIITTPNCFNLFNIAGKFSKREPTVNSDHVAYLNDATLRTLLGKNGFSVLGTSFVYTLHSGFQESWKKKILNILYYLTSWFTDKYLETLVVVAAPKKQ